MRILISPYANALRIKKKNPKNYPWWSQVTDLLKDRLGPKCNIIQVGTSEDSIIKNVDGLILDKKFLDLCAEINKCDTWASVDTYFHHVASYVKKPGVVIWSQSDPKHFGDELHTNLFKDKKYFRKEQFQYWDMTNYNEEAFVEPEVVVDAILKLL